MSIKVVRNRLLKQPKGDKAFVDVLLMATQSRRFTTAWMQEVEQCRSNCRGEEAGLEAMETACELTLETSFDCTLLFSVEFLPANKVDTEQGKVLTQLVL